jgi:hypothetical protein
VKSTTARVPQRVVDSEGMSRGMKPPESLRLNMEGRDIVTSRFRPRALGRFPPDAPMALPLIRRQYLS